MKTERRHDLETNELARRATVWIEKVKPYSAQIVGVVVVLLGFWVVSSIWGSVSSSQDEAAWDAYDLALTSSDLEMTNMQQVANNELYENSPVQEWAFAAWADRQLYIASREYLSDRSLAMDRLGRVEAIYEEVAANASDDQLRNRARFGLGRVYEIQNKLEQAREQFDQVQGDLQPLARLYSDRLLTPEAKETYAWLSTAELPRRSKSAAGESGSRPNFDAILPDATEGGELNVKTLEDILSFPNKNSDEDRYKKDDAKSATDGEATNEAADTGDDIFGEPEPTDSPASDDADQP
jgi:hypothetical protein